MRVNNKTVTSVPIITYQLKSRNCEMLRNGGHRNVYFAGARREKTLIVNDARTIKLLIILLICGK